MVTLPRADDSCGRCRKGTLGLGLGFELSMALQPIVDVHTREVFAQEALVRGAAGEPASHILAQVNDDNRYRFDQGCRVRAVQLAAKLGITSRLSINFLPNAVYQPERCIRTTVAAAEDAGFPLDRIILEITESERIADVDRLRAIVSHYRACGFRTALDDFGAGYSGLNLLADLQTDLIKLDMALVRDIDRHLARRSIVRGILQVCNDLGIDVIAEGVETVAERRALEDLGIRLFQGYLFARPTFEGESQVRFE